MNKFVLIAPYVLVLILIALYYQSVVQIEQCEVVHANIK